jgi:hypothetical protein
LIERRKNTLMTTPQQRQYLLLEVLLAREDPLVSVLLPESYRDFTIISREPGGQGPQTTVTLIVDPGREVDASDEHVLTNWRVRQYVVEACVVVLSTEEGGTTPALAHEAAPSLVLPTSWPPDFSRIAIFVFQEQVVLHAARLLIGDDLTELRGALDYLQWACLGYTVLRCAVRPDDGQRYIAFYADPTFYEAVIFRAMEQIERRWRQGRPPETIPFRAREADLARVLALYTAAAPSGPTEAMQPQRAADLLLPCGPYQTARGPVLVRCNNVCRHEVCPFCSADFKPPCGLWAFLFGLGGAPICFDCWRKGALVSPSEALTLIPAVAGHQHELEPDDFQGYSGECHCGARWTFNDGWWRPDDHGTWRREAPLETAG